MDGGNFEDDLGRIQRIRTRPSFPLSLLRSTLDLGRSCGLPWRQSWRTGFAEFQQSERLHRRWQCWGSRENFRAQTITKWHTNYSLWPWW